MNRQKQYLADNVDANGNVFPTVGENIRFGANGGSVGYPIKQLTNFRFLTINSDADGIVTLSENIKVSYGYGGTDKLNYIIFNEYAGNVFTYAISNPLMIWVDARFDGDVSAGIYQPFVDNEGGGFGIRNIPYNSHAVFYIADVIRE